MFFSVGGVLALFALALAHLCFGSRFFVRPIKKARRVLLIIAHPDDECMFFGPSILSLIEHGAAIHVLCLSSGNREQRGLRRKVELRHSCQILGIPIGNITIIEHTKLPDDPKSSWNKSIIKHIVLRYIEQLSIETVITFDSDGVSGHLNHRCIYRAVQHMYTKAVFPPATQVLVLETCALPRKYIGVFDLLLSSLSSTHLYVSSCRNLLRAQRAMCQHRTQLKWYRLLYILFSRYMVINTLQRIKMDEKYYKYDKDPGRSLFK